MKTAVKRRANSSSAANEKDIGPYANEPVADEDWLVNYREKRQKCNEDLMVWKNLINGKYITLILLRDLGFRDLSASTYTS